VTRDSAKGNESDVPGLIGLIAHDTERLIAQHLALARSELREGLSEVAPAVASIGAGAALMAAGGVLGSLMLVHGLHKATRLPLWSCYGLVGATLTSLGAGLLASGTHDVANINLTPRQTITALREDLEWIKDQATLPGD